MFLMTEEEFNLLSEQDNWVLDKKFKIEDINEELLGKYVDKIIKYKLMDTDTYKVQKISIKEFDKFVARFNKKAGTNYNKYSYISSLFYNTQDRHYLTKKVSKLPITNYFTRLIDIKNTMVAITECKIASKSYIVNAMIFFHAKAKDIDEVVYLKLDAEEFCRKNSFMGDDISIKPFGEN